MKYGQSLIESLEKEIESIYSVIDERHERIGRHETDYDDCFLSINSNASHINLCRLKIQIIKNGGTMPFEVLYKNSIRQNGTVISGKYGPVWLLEGGIFVPVFSHTSQVSKKVFKDAGMDSSTVYASLNDARIDNDNAEVDRLESLLESAKQIFYSKKGYELKYEERPVWATYSGGLLSTGCKIFESHTNYATGEQI